MNRRVIVTNFIDAISLSVLMVIFTLHAAAASTCTSPDGAHSNATALLAGGLSTASSASESHGDPVRELYDGCRLLWWSQLMLAWDAIFCFVRVFSWLTVAQQKLGVLSVILMALLQVGTRGSVSLAFASPPFIPHGTKGLR